jgi:RHS repeat-associated protein
VLLSLSATAVQGEQTFDSYGIQRYTSGTLGTDKGYTGQVTDSLSGLDYYNARFYLPDSGVFLSPDSVQGNAQGANPYAYVAGNPETYIDPSGHEMERPIGGGGGGEEGGDEGALDTSDFPVQPVETSTDESIGSNITEAQAEEGVQQEENWAQEEQRIDQEKREAQEEKNVEEPTNKSTQPTEPPTQPTEQPTEKPTTPGDNLPVRTNPGDKTNGVFVNGDQTTSFFVHLAAVSH